MEILDQVSALAELVDEARTLEQFGILNSWYEEIEEQAKSSGQTIPTMHFNNGVIEYQDSVWVFPPSRGKPKTPNPSNKTESSSNIDSVTKELLEQQRTRFIGKIATHWVEQGYSIRILRGTRALGYPDFDILTRRDETGEDAIAECPKPGNACFMIKRDHGDWQEAFAQSKQQFALLALAGRGYRMIHNGSGNDWYERAIDYFSEEGES